MFERCICYYARMTRGRSKDIPINSERLVYIPAMALLLLALTFSRVAIDLTAIMALLYTVGALPDTVNCSSHCKKAGNVIRKATQSGRVL